MRYLVKWSNGGAGNHYVIYPVEKVQPIGMVAGIMGQEDFGTLQEAYDWVEKRFQSVSTSPHNRSRTSTFMVFISEERAITHQCYEAAKNDVAHCNGGLMTKEMEERFNYYMMEMKHGA